MHFGQKTIVIGFPDQGVVLDAVIVADASTHDGQTFLPHVRNICRDARLCVSRRRKVDQFLEN